MLRDMLSKALSLSCVTLACLLVGGEAAAQSSELVSAPSVEPAGAQPAEHATAPLADPAAAQPAQRANATPAGPPPAVLRPAGEVNIAWPFIGISELKILVPAFGGTNLRGEVLAGTYADYAQVLGGRPKDPGKVWILAPLIGYRQFFAYGIHVELAVIVGLRHEDDYEGQAGVTLNDFYVRALPMAGWQWEISDRFYLNARAGAGILIYRQTHEAQETKVLPTADLNFGFRF